MMRSARLKDRVVILDEGGNWRGVGTAWKMSEDGHQVTIVTADPLVGKELQRSAADFPARQTLARLGVAFETERAILEWTAEGARVVSLLTGAEKLVPAGSLVLATTNMAEDSLAGELAARGVRFRLIGDCASPRQAAFAFYEGRKAGIELVHIPLREAQAVAEGALAAHGCSAAHAAATGRSIVAAEAEGNHAVGFLHLIDYCEALDTGRIDGTAEPLVEHPSATVVRIDARQGFPHLGVDTVWAEFAAAAQRSGIAVLSLSNGFTCGALGYFARRLADGHGLAGLVAANAGPAVMPASGGRRRVFCTNPLAFALPWPERGALVIDQSSAATAIVGLKKAAAEGKPIPEGWAFDADGQPTTDPEKALEGTMLAFGGARGANIALMVELLAAGLTGANWSAEAPAFNAGSASPGVGLLIIAIDPAATAGSGFAAHLQGFADLLATDPGVHLHGLAKGRRAGQAAARGLPVDAAVWDRIRALA